MATPPDPRSHDFAIIGAGEAGQAAAYLARARGASVAIADRELFGGSCPYWACMPSKTLVHAAGIHALGGAYPWPTASARRDWMINREDRDWPDDARHVTDLEAAGALVVRGEARIDGPGRVIVRTATNEQTLTARSILVVVGTNATIPDDIEGLDAIEPWTNRQATTTRTLPASLAILGAGPTGVELRCHVRVTPHGDVMRAPIEATGMDERIRNAAFALLLRDRTPIEPAELARIVGLDRAAAADVFEDLARNGRIDRDDGGRITGAAGLSLEHGPHSLTLAEGRFRTWCAYDALGIAAALGTDATIETACGQCGATIRLEVHAGVPQRREPERLWLAAGGECRRCHARLRRFARTFGKGSRSVIITANGGLS